MKLVTIKDTPTRIPTTRLKKLFEIVCDDEAEPDWRATVNLIFSTDKRLRALNNEFRHKDSATDVLSFNLEDPADENHVFGEIYISTATAEKQARGYGGSLSEEYLRLTCHGLLHLFGYDHQKEAEADVMRSLEERYLSRLEERN